MKYRVLALLLAALLSLSACGGQKAPSSGSIEAPPAPSVSPSSQSQPEPEPAPEPEIDNSWGFDAPENHRMDPEVLDRLHQILPGTTVSSMVTVRDGVIVDEYYKEGYDETSAFPIHSCSKSITSALVGIAIQQGYIGGVDDLLSDYLPQVAELEGAGKELTLRHLLTHTSGLEWREWTGPTNWMEFQTAENWVDYILGRQQVAQPGAVFNYSTGNTHLLAAALEAAVGKSLLEYGRENLFAPMGIETLTWGTDPQGVTDGGNGVRISSLDAARFGQLYLQKGSWKGEQLVPESWVEESTTPQNGGYGDSAGSYGYQWWIRPYTQGAYGSYPPPYGPAQYDTYMAFGAWGQFIIVVPQLELVTVITSQGPQGGFVPRPYFTDYILAACME